RFIRFILVRFTEQDGSVLRFTVKRFYLHFTAILWNQSDFMDELAVGQKMKIENNPMSR
ncbi:hypothetical protein KSS87_004837, partial [Heliosperma pusillum]